MVFNRKSKRSGRNTIFVGENMQKSVTNNEGNRVRIQGRFTSSLCLGNEDFCLKNPETIDVGEERKKVLYVTNKRLEGNSFVANIIFQDNRCEDRWVATNVQGCVNFSTDEESNNIPSNTNSKSSGKKSLKKYRKKMKKHKRVSNIKNFDKYHDSFTRVKSGSKNRNIKTYSKKYKKKYRKK